MTRQRDKANGSDKPSLDRIQRYKLGHRAELLAAILLRLKGYRILERRYKTPVGEVDLIARRFSRLAFVEVKARKDIDSALITLTPRLQTRVSNAAVVWLQRNPAYQHCEIGLDAIFIMPRRWPCHLINVFDRV